MNTKGIAFVETLLTIVIVLIIAGSLVPLSYHLKSILYNEKIELHASETALEAAKIIKTQAFSHGKKIIDRMEYQWTYDGEQICVQFEDLNGVRITCIDQNGGPS